MKLVKMSLAAAVLLGASAFALDNVKLDGDAKLYYGTNNAGKNSLFSKGTDLNAPSGNSATNSGGSFADASVRLGVSGDLTKGVSFGGTVYGVSTLGLENNLVGQTWTGAHAVGTGNGAPYGGGAQANDHAWIGEAWVASTLGKTTAKLGRMSLDTPLAYSETWSVVPNTFDAVVAINQDLPDTTLVGAYVGKGNGVNALGTSFNAAVHTAIPAAPAGMNLGAQNLGIGVDGIVGNNGFNTFANSGAYAVAAVNNSFKPLTAQAWYYNVSNIADAYWLQGDVNCQMVKDLKIGAQYADMSPKGALKADGVTKDSKAYAFKLGYEGVQNLKVSAAYSKADKDGVLKVANVATNNLVAAQSKLYTEAYWNYGYVGAPDARTYALAGEYNAGVATVGAQYTDVSIGGTNALNVALGQKHDVKMKEIALYASKSFGPLDATVAYMSTAADDLNVKTVGAKGTRFDTVLAMLKLNF
ncbi:MAG: hypothetical protein PHO27_04255 [Sulfuricurvum sp.]|nr:hypothetical protein [Sulfuricurvum sp.]